MILFDTDIMIDLLRHYPPAVEWLDSLGSEEIILPGFVAMELIQGCRDKTELNELKDILHEYVVAWPSASTCSEALSVFSNCYLSHGLGILDALIGQMAVNLNIRLCTFNQKHYSVFSDLHTIQPYEKRN